MFYSFLVSFTCFISVLTQSDKPTFTFPEKPMVLEGQFSSLKGVMHPLSCYCYNGGKLTLQEGTIVYVCFPKDDIDITCTNVKIKGRYVTRRLEATSQNACASGTMKYFEASSFVCK